MTIHVNTLSTTGTTVDWSNITNIPACFPPCQHGWLHTGSQTDPVPLVTATDSGLVPHPPAGSGSNYYFGGDLAWHNIALASSGIVTLGGPGLVPTLTGTAGQYFSATSPAQYKQVAYSELSGVPASFPADWSTITSKPATFPPSAHATTHALAGSDPVYPDWTQVQNKPATFPPSPHAASHVTGSDQIVSAGTTNKGLLNQLSGSASDYVGGDNACHNLATTLTASLIPPGVVCDFAGATAPSGWLMCDGSTVSRTTYASLFAVIGTTYGAGDGSTTFTLPDSRGRVSVGAGGGSGLSFYNLGQTGGEESHLLSTAEMPSHAHSVYDPSHNHPDPGHNHGFNDPGHAHGISQTPHAHTASSYTSINYGTTTPGFPFYEAVAANTGAANANVSVNGAGTGCYNSASGANLYAAGTGIGIYAAGGGQYHNNLQPYRAYNKIIKT